MKICLDCAAKVKDTTKKCPICKGKKFLEVDEDDKEKIAEITESIKTKNMKAPTKKKGKGCLTAIVVLIVLSVLGALISGGENETVIYKVGEVAVVDDVAIRFNGISTNQGNSFMKPASGNVYLFCDFTIQNNSSKEITVSSMMCFDAYVDGYSYNIDIGALSAKNDQKNQLDGSVAPGKKITGIVAYEVPKGFKEVEVRVKPSFWGGKEAIFQTTR